MRRKLRRFLKKGKDTFLVRDLNRQQLQFKRIGYYHREHRGYRVNKNCWKTVEKFKLLAVSFR